MNEVQLKLAILKVEARGVFWREVWMSSGFCGRGTQSMRSNDTRVATVGVSGKFVIWRENLEIRGVEHGSVRHYRMMLKQLRLKRGKQLLVLSGCWLEDYMGSLLPNLRLGTSLKYNLWVLRLIHDWFNQINKLGFTIFLNLVIIYNHSYQKKPHVYGLNGVEMYDS